MQLELLNEQGQATSKVDAPDTVFARDYNEALVHQIVVAFQANARQGTRAQLDRGDGQALDQEAVAPEGHRPRPRRHDLVAAVARRRPDLPEQPGRELHARRSTRRCTAPAWRPILSQLAREGRLAVVDSLTVDSPKTKALAQKFKAMGLDSVLVITDQMADNLMLASRNLRQRAGGRAALRRSARRSCTTRRCW